VLVPREGDYDVLNGVGIDVLDQCKVSGVGDIAITTGLKFVIWKCNLKRSLGSSMNCDQ